MLTKKDDYNNDRSFNSVSTDKQRFARMFAGGYGAVLSTGVGLPFTAVAAPAPANTPHKSKKTEQKNSASSNNKNENKSKSAEYDSMFGMMLMQALIGGPVMDMLSESFDIPEEMMDVDWATMIELYDYYKCDRLAAKEQKMAAPRTRMPLTGRTSRRREKDDLLAFISAFQGTTPPGYHAGLESWHRASASNPPV